MPDLEYGRGGEGDGGGVQGGGHKQQTLSFMMTLNNILILIIKVLPSSTPVTPISQPIIEILTRNFQDAFRFPKNTLSVILTLNINNKILPSSAPVTPISQPIIEILTRNFQDAFR